MIFYPGDIVFHLHLWWCGDDVCNCRQPRIDKRKVSNGGWPNAYLIDTPWEGTFFTDGGDIEDWILANQEGRDAEWFLYRMKIRYGAPILIAGWWGF
jgi:hypothetical protein